MLKPWPATHAQLTCGRYNDERRRVIEGAVLKECWNCKFKVFASPASLLAARKQAPYHIICFECAIEYERANGRPTHVLPLTDAQRFEIQF